MLLINGSVTILEFQKLESRGDLILLNRLEMLRIFCAAVDVGNFKEAAHRLGISPQAVTRAVQVLENLQGELLFHRNTRRTQVTQAGEELAIKARQSLRQIDELFEAGSPVSNNELVGRVRITAPIFLGRRQIMPVLTELARKHPGLELDLTLNDAIADVVDDKIDIGLRIGFVRDNRFIVRQLAKVHFHVVATPELIARVGVPQTPADLQTLPVTASQDRNNGKFWPWFFSEEKQWTPIRPRFSTDDSESEVDAVMAGLAFGQLHNLLINEELEQGLLTPVLEEFAPEPWDLYIYRPQRGPVPARIRLVFDTLVAYFSQ